MLEAARCPDCGTEIVAEPGIPGLCPLCLLSLARLQSDPGPEAPTLDHPAAGRVLGERYQLRELLGRGGMGEVHRAFDLKLRVDVALKAVRPDQGKGARAIEMLRREVRSAREVVSPNVCRIFDLVDAGDEELVSMEYVDGQTLAEVLRERGPLELREAREIASQLLSGLEAIHRAGLVHRDVKPENVMLTRAGRVVVMDLGLAKVPTSGRTATIAGTPAYMAPEQSRGDAVDARADVFAAGVVLAEMLSVGGESSPPRQELWRGIRESPPRVPESQWSAVLRQCVAVDPSSRPASAHALARALEEVTQRLPEFEQERPYPGLSSFTEADAEYFHGRELEVEAVVKKLKRPRMLALVGPSGAGKSSFLRAGLLPTLPGSWTAVITTPGTRPFQSLAQVLLPHLAQDMSAMQEFLRFEEPDVAVGLVARWRKRHEHALVIVDQAEELFTQNTSEVQASFATLLGRLVLEADAHVVLSLRDDFLVHCHGHEALAPILNELTLLGPLGESGLRRALVQPALSCGYHFEDEALVDEMVQSVRGERGALPLLAFAASRLWDLRDRERGLLTWAAYRDIGGVAGALAQHAEATLGHIGTSRTPLVRELFRNLVTAQGTRAVREREELLSVFAAAPGRNHAEKVLRELVDARLLTEYERAGEDDESRPQVEIVHESLLQAWPRLVRWRAQDEDGAQLRDQLRQAAQTWHDRGRAADLLWTGSAFRDLVAWRERSATPLTASEGAFVQATVRQANRRRARKRAVVAALAVVAGAVATVTTVLWRKAENARRGAEAEARRAEAGKLVALGEREFERFPTGALAFAAESLEVADTEPARLLALRVLEQGPVARIAPVATDPAVEATFSPSGEWLGLGGFSRIDLLHRDGGQARHLAEFASRGVARTSLGFSPAGDVLAAGLRGEVRLLSVPDGRELRRAQPEAGAGTLYAGESGFLTLTRPAPNLPTLVRWWPFGDGEPRLLGSLDTAPGWTSFASGRLAYTSEHGTFMRSVEGGLSPPRRFGGPVWGVALRADAKALATSDDSGEIRLWNTSAPHDSRPERVVRAPGTPGVHLDPTGRWLGAAGMPEGRPTVRVFDLQVPADTDPLVLVRGDTGYQGKWTFDRSGSWCVTTHGADVAFWWLGGVRSRVLRGPETGATNLAFTPDGRWLLSVSGDGTVQAWPMALGDEPRILHRVPTNFTPVLAVAPSGEQAAVGFDKGRLHLVSLDGGSPRELGGFSERTGIGAVAFADAGRLLAAAPSVGPREQKVVRVYRLDSGETRTFGPLPGTGEGNAGGIRGLAFVGTERLLASVTGSGLVSIDLRTGETRVMADRPDQVFAVAPAAGLGVGLRDAGAPDGVVSLVRFPLDGQRTDVLTSQAGLAEIALDAAGGRVATGALDGTVRVAAASGSEAHVLLGHRSMINALAFSQDGRWLASSSEDLTIRVWPVPDVSSPPLHRRSHDDVLRVLRSHTNLRAVRDARSLSGYRLEPGPFPGWATAPEW